MFARLMHQAIAAVVLFAAAPAWASDPVRIEVDRVSVSQYGRMEAIIAVENQSGSPLQVVTVACAFLGADGKAVGVGKDSSFDVRPGARIYQTVSVRQEPGMESAECYVDRAF